LLVLVLAAGCTGVPKEIDPEADTALRAMCKALAEAKTFRFRADASIDEELPSGQVVQFEGTRRVAVRRPNGLAVLGSGAIGNRRAWYDGKTLSMLDLDRRMYGSVKAPSNLDDFLDFLIEEYDMTIPLADILYARPYDVLTENVRVGEYLGIRTLGGHRCHQIVFEQDAINWEIWIDAGKTPVPRRLVITHKMEPGEPQFRATLSNWDLSTKVPDSVFVFKPPKDAARVDVEMVLPRVGEGGE
jgi:hypothetical protein